MDRSTDTLSKRLAEHHSVQMDSRKSYMHVEKISKGSWQSECFADTWKWFSELA
jgi:hypothetical protein